MQSKSGHENWHYAAMVKDAKNADRIRVICRVGEEMQLVKEAAYKTAVAGVRIMRDQFYPVKRAQPNRRSKVMIYTDKPQRNPRESQAHTC